MITPEDDNRIVRQSEFIQRIKPHPLAVRVKLGDLRDNMDIRRAGALDERALERFQRYRKAWFELTEKR